MKYYTLNILMIGREEPIVVEGLQASIPKGYEAWKKSIAEGSVRPRALEVGKDPLHMTLVMSRVEGMSLEVTEVEDPEDL